MIQESVLERFSLESFRERALELGEERLETIHRRIVHKIDAISCLHRLLGWKVIPLSEEVGCFQWESKEEGETRDRREEAPEEKNEGEGKDGSHPTEGRCFVGSFQLDDRVLLVLPQEFWGPLFGDGDHQNLDHGDDAYLMLRRDDPRLDGFFSPPDAP